MDDNEVFEFTGQFLPNGRPVFKNQYGDFVTERTITEYVPELGGWVNVPTFFDGRLLEPRQAIGMAIELGGVDPVTNEPIEPFESLDSAVRSAQEKSSGLGGLLNKMFNGSRK